jgi:hypothetical protein
MHLYESAAVYDSKALKHTADDGKPLAKLMEKCVVHQEA